MVIALIVAGILLAYVATGTVISQMYSVGWDDRDPFTLGFIGTFWPFALAFFGGATVLALITAPIGRFTRGAVLRRRNRAREREAIPNARVIP